MENGLDAAPPKKDVEDAVALSEEAIAIPTPRPRLQRVDSLDLDAEPAPKKQEEEKPRDEDERVPNDASGEYLASIPS